MNAFQYETLFRVDSSVSRFDAVVPIVVMSRLIKTKKLFNSIARAVLILVNPS